MILLCLSKPCHHNMHPFTAGPSLKVDRSLPLNPVTKPPNTLNSHLRTPSPPAHQLGAHLCPPEGVHLLSQGLGGNNSNDHMGSSSSIHPPPLLSHPHLDHTPLHKAMNSVTHPHPHPLAFNISRPSSREASPIICTTIPPAAQPVIGPGPLGILRHLAASRGVLSGARPLSPAFDCNTMAEQVLLQGRSLGSSLGSAGTGLVGRASVLPQLKPVSMQGLPLQAQPCSQASPHSPPHSAGSPTGLSPGGMGNTSEGGALSSHAFTGRDLFHPNESSGQVHEERSKSRLDMPPSSHQLRPIVFAPKEAAVMSALIRSTSATGHLVCPGDKPGFSDVSSSLGLGGKGILHTRNLTDRLHAEVDAVQGGVAAILLKHGHTQAVLTQESCSAAN